MHAYPYTDTKPDMYKVNIDGKDFEIGIYDTAFGLAFFNSYWVNMVLVTRWNLDIKDEKMFVLVKLSKDLYFRRTPPNAVT